MDLFNFLSWEPANYHFSRNVFDMRPYQLIRDDKKTTIVFNALGMKPDDIKIDVHRDGNKDFLSIRGETKLDIAEKTYSINADFYVNQDEINYISWNAENGLLFIDIYWKEATPSSIKINRK